MICIDGIWGHLLEGDVAYLKWLASTGDRFLEIGSHMGLSASIILQANQDARIVCVDSWADDVIEGHAFKSLIDIFRANMILHGLIDRVEMVHRKSDDAEVTGIFDAAWVDGWHIGLTPYRDALKAWNVVRDGGVVCGHDAVPGSDVEACAHEFAAEVGREMRIYEAPQCHYIWEVVK